jgi:uncharacterized phiE125 gp8 family phage protein
MGLTLYTAPTLNPVGLPEAKLHLRQESDEDDLLIQNLIYAATETAQVKTGRQFLTATYDYTLDDFPGCDTIVLPRPPLASVTSITYVDGDGVSQTLAATVYEVVTNTEPGGVRLKYDQIWPIVRDQADAVTIRYVCGWTSAANIPYSLKAWVNLYVSHLYENRDLIVTGTIVNELPFLDSLLNQHRVFTVS